MNKFLICLSFIALSFSMQATAQTCDWTLWAHVYHNYRLYIMDSCMSVTGTIKADYGEADGDHHIRLQVDPTFNYLLNAANISDESGDLVCEPVCSYAPITQADAVSSCTGFTNTVYLPAIGEYVKVTGPWVTDNDHGWNELHPITSIVIVPNLTGVANQTRVVPTVKVSPNPANDYVNFDLNQKPSNVIYISISDELGRLAGQYQMLEMTNLKINTDFWPNGMYFYNISQDGRSTGGGKFAVKHQ